MGHSQGTWEQALAALQQAGFTRGPHAPSLPASGVLEQGDELRETMHSLEIRQKDYCVPFQSHASTLNKAPKMSRDPRGKGTLIDFLWIRAQAL